MQLLFANNAVTTLGSALSSTATSCQLASGGGALFPNPTPNAQYFVVTFLDAATQTVREIAWCTARTGDTLTLLRAQEGTTALSWAVGDIVAELWTAGQAQSVSGSGAGGPAGGVLTGTYPNPGLGVGVVESVNIAAEAVGTAELGLNAVTNAGLAQMAAATIKGNVSGAEANPVDIPISSLLTALGFGTEGLLGITLPSGGAGSLGSNGYITFGPFIINICTIMLQDPGASGSTTYPWTFAKPFPNNLMAVLPMNIALLAGQSNYSAIGVVSLAGITDVSNTLTGINVGVHNTQTGGTQVAALLVAIGN